MNRAARAEPGVPVRRPSIESAASAPTISRASPADTTGAGVGAVPGPGPQAASHTSQAAKWRVAEDGDIDSPGIGVGRQLPARCTGPAESSSASQGASTLRNA